MTMKKFQIFTLVCMLVVGVLFSLILFIDWKFLHISIILETIPYMLLPISLYAGMKTGFSSKCALVLDIVAFAALALNIWLLYFSNRDDILSLIVFLPFA